MSDFAVAPLAPLIVDLGALYWPPAVTVPLLRTDEAPGGTSFQTGINDNVTLSTAAQVYLSGLTSPGPDQSEALTQIGAGPVISFVSGDYAGAVLVGQDLHGAVFDGANLQDANFSSANLQGAQFIDTSVQGARFTQTDLRGADLTGALDLEPGQVYGAIYDSSTTFPSGIGNAVFGPASSVNGNANS